MRQESLVTKPINKLRTATIMYKKLSADFLNYFHEIRDELLQILIQMENYKTAIEEYKRADRTLSSIESEEIEVDFPLINQYSAYLPYNNVLYSLVLYAIVPSLMAKKVFVRPSHLSSGVAKQIFSLLQPYFNTIELESWSRREFLNRFVLESDVVAFTGRYSNLPEVSSALNDHQMLIYGGDGLVTFIIHNDANIQQSVEGAIRDRFYASGQDCICPDVFMVHESIIDKFIEALTVRLKQLKFGPHVDKNADYSSILKAEVVLAVRDFLLNLNDKIIFGGKVDIENKIVPPTVLLDDNLLQYSYFEFYSPVFRIFKYKNLDDIRQFYSLPFQSEFRMGASVYGGEEIAKYLVENKIIVARNQTFFDIENGNRPFGGYGIRASHVQFMGSVVARPILVSREIKNYVRFQKR